MKCPGLQFSISCILKEAAVKAWYLRKCVSLSGTLDASSSYRPLFYVWGQICFLKTCGYPMIAKFTELRSFEGLSLLKVSQSDLGTDSQFVISYAVCVLQRSKKIPKQRLNEYIRNFHQMHRKEAKYLLLNFPTCCLYAFPSRPPYAVDLLNWGLVYLLVHLLQPRNTTDPPVHDYQRPTGSFLKLWLMRPVWASMWPHAGNRWRWKAHDYLGWTPNQPKPRKRERSAYTTDNPLFKSTAPHAPLNNFPHPYVQILVA